LAIVTLSSMRWSFGTRFGTLAVIVERRSDSSMGASSCAVSTASGRPVARPSSSQW